MDQRKIPDIPDDILNKIFSYLTYKEINNVRQVSTRFNKIGAKIISNAFVQVQSRYTTLDTNVKSTLPEVLPKPERKKYAKSKHMIALFHTATHMSIFNVICLKLLEMEVICFIPGKLLDKIVEMLDLVEYNDKLPSTGRLLWELDILFVSAGNHFNEHIQYCGPPKCKKPKLL